MLPTGLLLPLSSFDEICEAVLSYLEAEVPLSFWSVSRHVGGAQVSLAVRDHADGKVAGASPRWSDFFSQHVVTGEAPQIAPDAMAVPQFAAAGVAQAAAIGAYVGIPILDAEGQVFGTLCGLDPQVQPEALTESAPLLTLLATLLSQALRAEQALEQVAAREAALLHRATHDELTGLANRDGFREELARAIGRARLEDEDVSVLLGDVDDFKVINEVFGHHAADGLLRQVADRLHAVLSDDAVAVARLGSDEFGAVLTPGADLQVVAQRVVQAFSDPFYLDGIPVLAPLSLGTADSRTAAGSTPGAQRITLSGLVGCADVAMATARRDGGARWAPFLPGMFRPESDDLFLAEPLAHALASGEVRAEFQPVVDLGTRRAVGAEALARWTHEGESISPARFLPVARRAGLLPELTETMIDQALEQLSRWTTSPSLERLTVSVNVSASLICDRDLPVRVEAALRRHRVAPERLSLEVTEEALLHDVEAAHAVTTRLRDLGTRLVLDDFGTGSSSMLHLRSMPFDAMKLDRLFLHDIDTNTDTQHFVTALMRLALDLDLQVVAEGVERRSQADMLRHLGCTRAQGHLFSPAVAPQLIDGMLNHPLGLALPVQRSAAAAAALAAGQDVGLA